jgi:hypothetical protein
VLYQAAECGGFELGAGSVIHEPSLTEVVGRGEPPRC